MTRAAELLHVTQPTLSKQLKALEEELGKKLFTRHSFSIQLTEEGIRLRKPPARYFPGGINVNPGGLQYKTL